MARYVESIGPVGTCYAATSERAACLESVLHDLPLDPPGVFSLADLAHYRIAALKLDDAIQCVSFHTPFLPKLHLTRGQLIDSEAACYPETRAWAQAAFDQRPRHRLGIQEGRLGTLPDALPAALPRITDPRGAARDATGKSTAAG